MHEGQKQHAYIRIATTQFFGAARYAIIRELEGTYAWIQNAVLSGSPIPDTTLAVCACPCCVSEGFPQLRLLRYAYVLTAGNICTARFAWNSVSWEEDACIAC